MNKNKQYELRLCSNGIYYLYHKGTLINNPYIDFDKFNRESAESIISNLNNLSEENEELKVGEHDLALELNALVDENEYLKNRVVELEEKVYHNLAWFLMYNDYFGIDLGEAIWNNADLQDHDQERELLNEYISIAKERFNI